MNKKFLKKVIKNYKRNQKRIEEIKRDIYSGTSIDYTKINSQNGYSDMTTNLIHQFDTNKERIKLQSYIDAVDRMILRLDDKEKTIYELYFIKCINWRGIENRGYGKSTIFRSLDAIYTILNEEL